VTKKMGNEGVLGSYRGECSGGAREGRQVLVRMALHGTATVQQRGNDAARGRGTERLQVGWPSTHNTFLFIHFFQMDSNFRWSKDDILLLEKFQIKYKIV
jgi:hypothetical protein